MTNKEKTKYNWNKIKLPIVTTMEVRERAMFYILAYRKFGYGKYSIQKALTEAVTEWNNRQKENYPKGSADLRQLLEEIRQFILTDVKNDKITSQDLERNKIEE